jgi:hypothetical protein
VLGSFDGRLLSGVPPLDSFVRLIKDELVRARRPFLLARLILLVSLLTPQYNKLTILGRPTRLGGSP